MGTVWSVKNFYCLLTSLNLQTSSRDQTRACLLTIGHTLRKNSQILFSSILSRANKKYQAEGISSTNQLRTSKICSGLRISIIGDKRYPAGIAGGSTSTRTLSKESSISSSKYSCSIFQFQEMVMTSLVLVCVLVRFMYFYFTVSKNCFLYLGCTLLSASHMRALSSLRYPIVGTMSLILDICSGSKMLTNVYM